MLGDSCFGSLAASTRSFKRGLLECGMYEIEGVCIYLQVGLYLDRMHDP